MYSVMLKFGLNTVIEVLLFLRSHMKEAELKAIVKTYANIHIFRIIHKRGKLHFSERSQLAI